MTAISTSGSTTNRTLNSENQITQIGGSPIGYDNNGNVTADDAGHILVYDACAHSRKNLT